MQDDTVVLCVQFAAAAPMGASNNGASNIGGTSVPAVDERASEVVMERPFDLDTVRQVRHELGAFLHGLGLSVERAELLVLAVNEGMINAVVHGGGGGLLTARHADGQLTVAVEDSLPSQPPTLPRSAPEATAEAGRGLWLIVQSFDVVRFEAGEAGLRLVMGLRLVAGRRHTPVGR